MRVKGIRFDLENNLIFLKPMALTQEIAWGGAGALVRYGNYNYEQSPQTEEAYPLEHFLFLDVNGNVMVPWENPRKTFVIHFSRIGFTHYQGLLSEAWNFHREKLVTENKEHFPFSVIEESIEFLYEQIERRVRGERLTPSRHPLHNFRRQQYA